MDTSSQSEGTTQIRHQEVVAELGQRALETEDIDQLTHDAAVAVAGTLDNEYCNVLELLPGGDEMLLREGIGWREELDGNATVSPGMDSQAGYTLFSGEPVLVDDLQTAERFSGIELFTDHDVGSGISVVIGSVEDPWGMLGTHTTDKREFTDHDAAFVQSIANVLASAIDNGESGRKRMVTSYLQLIERRYSDELDTSRLRQVFQNLLGKAIEYSGDDPPRVHIAAERDGPEWVLSIRDEGVGIDADDADRIFEVFQRLHVRDEHAGTGIALALCERIIERHGGDIWVESESGEGAVFSFTLPAAGGSDE